MEKLAWYKEPLLHFLLIGVLMFVAYSKLNPRGEEEELPEVPVEPIVVVPIHAHILEQIASRRAAELGGFPDGEELAGLFKDHLRMEVLYREAISMGLDQSDLGIRQRLARRLAFMVQGLPGSSQPTHEQLTELFTSNKEKYEIPAQIDFQQVFFSKKLRGDKALDDAVKVLSEFLALTDPTRAKIEQGDPSPEALSTEQLNQWQMEEAFGAIFTKTTSALEIGIWSGPVESERGYHLVLVTEKREARIPELSETLDRITEDWYTNIISSSRQSQSFSSFIASCDFQFDDETTALMTRYGVEREEILP